MRVRPLLIAMSVAVFLACAVTSRAEEKLTEDQIKALAAKVKDYPTKHKLISVGLPAVAPLFEHFSSEDARMALEVKSALRWIAVWASYSPQKRDALAAFLARYIKSDQPAAVRGFAAELLGITGGEKAASMLAPMLKDEKVRDQALGAIQLIKNETATQALLATAAEAPPAFRRAVLRVIGERRDTAGTKLLIAAAADKDEKVHLAALEALGTMGDPTAIPTLEEAAQKGSPAEKAAAVKALIGVADALLGHGEKKKAAERYVQAFKLASDDAQRVAALKGMGRTGQVSALSVIDEALKSKKENIRAAALDAHLRVAEALLQAGDKKAAAPAFYAALEVATRDSERIRALVGCGSLGSEEPLDRMAKYLHDPSPRVQVAAASAMNLIKGKKATAVLANTLAKASPALQYVLLQALGERHDPDTDTVSAVAAVVDAPDENVKIAAAKALGRIASPKAIPSLLKLIDQGGENVKPAALNAYLEIAEAQLKAGKRKEASEIYLRVLDMKDAGEALAEAFTGLAQIADPSTLPKIEAMLDTLKGSARDAAIDACIAVADVLAAEKPDEARKIYKKALGLVGSDPRSGPLRRKLRSVGEKMEFMCSDGKIRYWWIIGSFPAPDTKSWTKELPPEKEVNIQKEYQIGAKKYRWKGVQTDDKNARVDLDKQFALNEKCVAYAYAEVMVPKEQDVLLKMGSDDGIICWVNGQKVHEFIGPRSLKVDEDSVKVHLKKGTNSVLLKICEGGGSWEFCFRVTDLEGKGLRVKVQ